MSIQPPYVEKAFFPDRVMAGTPYLMQLSGNWPTPAWEHVNTEIEIDDASQVLTVRYLGKSKAGLAAQVITPFTDVIEITLPHEGRWTVTVQGRSRSHSQSVICT